MGRELRLAEWGKRVEACRNSCTGRSRNSNARASLCNGRRCPKEFLSGFKGYLHTDGYSGRNNLPENITVIGCWAHARRKFDEAMKSLPKGKAKTVPRPRGWPTATFLGRALTYLKDQWPYLRNYLKDGRLEPRNNEIFLPPNAPDAYKDRETLRNAVEKIEKHPKAQLA